MQVLCSAVTRDIPAIATVASVLDCMTSVTGVS